GGLAGGGGPGGGGGGGFGGSTAGPFVDPGEYTVRLTVDGRELTTPVVVEADPLVPLTTEERAARRTAIAAIMALQAKTEPAARQVASIGSQLAAVSKSLAGAPNATPAIRNAAQAAVKEAEALETELARINRSVTQLYGQVNGSPFLPTRTEHDEIDDLGREFGAKASSLDTLVKTTIPALERQMNEAGIPRIAVK
ncbi:MAG TPA: hypothetical protein VL309_05040, partial [Vicinamibacterales bacterium]|nr:hypothetical protein [Vicinamibacterales bacterium]